jgi:hypothetical protein
MTPSIETVPIGMRYLDLDGDGVPDAVQMTEAIEYDVTGDGVPDIVEIVDETAAGIGIDGVPDHVEVTEPVAVRVEHEVPSEEAAGS